MRLASGLAQAVNFMLGIYAEPPSGLHGWTKIYGEKLQMCVCIDVYNLGRYLYVDTQTQDTHTPPTTTTTTPHMLVTGTRIKRNNKTQPEQQALALRIHSMPELGFVPPRLGTSKKYPFDIKRKMFSKIIDI